MKPILLLLVLLVLLPQPTATAPQAPERDGVATLVGRLEEVLLSGKEARYLDLLSASADRAAAASFADSVFLPGVTRVAVRERDRMELVGTLPGDGYRLLLEVLSETGGRGRLATWRLDVRRMSGGDGAGPERWGIVNQEPLTVLNGLYRLSLNTTKQYTARDLVIESEDLKLSMPEGSVFVSEPDGGVPTGVVLIGRGEMEFKPAPAAERGQLRIFAGSEALQTPFEAVFLRVNPNDFAARIPRQALTERPVDSRDARRADEVFRQELPRSFGIDLGDLSTDTWSLLPNIGDFVAEVRTRRYETLTFARSSGEVEDISLFDRKNRRNISVYSSRANRQRFGRFYNEDDRADFIVRNYDVEASFNPSRRLIDGTTRMDIEIRGNGSASLTIRLAEPLTVRSIYSSEFGRLQSFRVRNQNSVIVNLPSIVTRGLRMTLSVSYSGVLDPQPVDREALAVSPQFIQQEEGPDLPAEDSLLYSNRSYWYPQPSTTSYSLATMRLTVPQGWGVAASGEPQGFVAVANPKGPSLRQFRFSTPNPARYLSCLVTALDVTKDETVHLGSSVEAFRSTRRPGVYYDDVRLYGMAQPRMRKRAKDLTRKTGELLKFYASLVGEAPYPTITMAVIEGSLPGGHSPAYLAVVTQPGIGVRLSYRDDPAAFMDYPEFFLAHEVAHQWWGQAVGWKNYHEQWLSEGFAQYFAALYAEKARGRGVFTNMMRRMRRFGVERTGEGPIYLGYRIGHVRNESRAFRAVVYNKAAVVLHQLRSLVGDEAFFRGVRRFYEDWRFRKAGTDDFRRAIEGEVGAPLDRFFERWVHGDTLPQLAFTYRVEEGEGGRSDAVVRFEQTGPVFDVPVTVTLDYLDRASVDVLVKVTDRVVEHRVPLTGKLKAITANKDELTLAEIK